MIAGANHFSYGDRQDADLIFRQLLERSPASQSDLINQKQVSTYIQTISIAFWDAYFKQENTAKEFLLSNSIQAFSQGEATVFSK